MQISIFAPKDRGELFTVANFITLIGFLCIFFYARGVIFHSGKWYGVFFVAMVGLTDLLDGYFARKLKQETFLGACMDPARDRIFLAVALWSFWSNDLIVQVATALIIIVEVVVSWIYFTKIKGINKERCCFFTKFRQGSHIVLTLICVAGFVDIKRCLAQMFVLSCVALGGVIISIDEEKEELNEF